MVGIDGGIILGRIFSQRTEDDTGASYVDSREKVRGVVLRQKCVHIRVRRSLWLSRVDKSKE